MPFLGGGPERNNSRSYRDNRFPPRAPSRSVATGLGFTFLRFSGWGSCRPRGITLDDVPECRFPPRAPPRFALALFFALWFFFPVWQCLVFGRSPFRPFRLPGGAGFFGFSAADQALGTLPSSAEDCFFLARKGSERVKDQMTVRPAGGDCCGLEDHPGRWVPYARPGVVSEAIGGHWVSTFDSAVMASAIAALRHELARNS